MTVFRQLISSGKAQALLAALAMSGCAQLPVDGPAHRDIDSGATASLSNPHETVVYDYAVVDINAAVLDCLSYYRPEALSSTFGSQIGSRPPVVRAGAGDVLQISIFESSTGGLFVPSEAGARPGNYITLPNQMVGSSGKINVPYAGEIRAAGLTTAEIEREIASKLAARAIEPQVLVSFVEQNAASVTVVGDVTGSVMGAGKNKITGTERILDVISRAGGLRVPGHELYVTLQRKNKKATVYFPNLIHDPKENIYVAPGDLVYVYRDPPRFIAVGALASVGATGATIGGETTGLSGSFTFDREHLSLNDALAKAGGLHDSRADPAQVFLYRIEPREILEKMGVNLKRFAPEQRLIPTIYRANFRDPSSFFVAQKFDMRNKDVIYVSNADAVEFTKFLIYLRNITSTASGVASDAATVVHAGP